MTMNGSAVLMVGKVFPANQLTEWWEDLMEGDYAPLQLVFGETNFKHPCVGIKITEIDEYFIFPPEGKENPIKDIFTLTSVDFQKARSEAFYLMRDAGIPVISEEVQLHLYVVWG